MSEVRSISTRFGDALRSLGNRYGAGAAAAAMALWGYVEVGNWMRSSSMIGETAFMAGMAVALVSFSLITGLVVGLMARGFRDGYEVSE